MNIIYVMWTGDTPDKGVATDDIVAFGRARETLRNSGITFKYALIPLTPEADLDAAITCMIKENS